jgi:competence protein ComEC
MFVRSSNFLKFFLVLFLVFLNSLIIIFYFFLNKERFHEIVFVDVGQGNGALIKTRGGKNIFIDTGFETKGIKNFSKEISFFNKDLDLIFLTHYDRDHGGKIPFFMKNYFVKIFVDSGVEKTQKSQESLFEEVKKRYLEKNVFKESILSGDFVFIENGVKIKVLFPFSVFDLEKVRSNNQSLVLQVFLDDTKILITGDLPQKYEKLLVQKYGKSLDSDILVAGHHGSKTSSAEDFLEAVSPEFFIVSSGKNSYGHPTKEVLDKAKKLNFKILRTDKLGNIKFLVGENLILEK